MHINLMLASKYWKFYEHEINSFLKNLWLIENFPLFFSSGYFTI